MKQLSELVSDEVARLLEAKRREQEEWETVRAARNGVAEAVRERVLELVELPPGVDVELDTFWEFIGDGKEELRIHPSLVYYDAEGVAVTRVSGERLSYVACRNETEAAECIRERLLPALVNDLARRVLDAVESARAVLRDVEAEMGQPDTYRALSRAYVTLCRLESLLDSEGLEFMSGVEQVRRERMEALEREFMECEKRLLSPVVTLDEAQELGEHLREIAFNLRLLSGTDDRSWANLANRVIDLANDQLDERLRAWERGEFWPYIVYRLDGRDEDGGPARPVYLVSPIPDPEGFYGRIRNGEVERYKPLYPVSITEVRIPVPEGEAFEETARYDDTPWGFARLTPQGVKLLPMDAVGESVTGNR